MYPSRPHARKYRTLIPHFNIIIIFCQYTYFSRKSVNFVNFLTQLLIISKSVQQEVESRVLLLVFFYHFDTKITDEIGSHSTAFFRLCTNFTKFEFFVKSTIHRCIIDVKSENNLAFHKIIKWDIRTYQSIFPLYERRIWEKRIFIDSRCIRDTNK